ncbi:hypothetical protein VitviT2T_018847 [Vitis vinifera]|nr:hypothetical protein VitviT2T_018847 [Vitis vinifera]
MEPKQSSSQNLAVEGTSQLGKAIDPDSDSDWEWDMNSDSDSHSHSDTLGFSNDPEEQLHQRWKWLKLPWRRPLSSHSVRFRNDLGEDSQRFLRRWPLSSEGDPDPMNLWKRVMKRLDKKAQFDVKAEASGASCAHSQILIYMKHRKRVMKWLKELDKKAQFGRKAKALRALFAHSQNLIRSKINITGPSTRDADLATQIEEIENQLLAERQERKPSQQSGEAERQERKPSQQSGEAERQERKPSQQSG